MQSNRDFYISKKPKLVLNKGFSVFKDLEVGMIGQLKVLGVIEADEIAGIEECNEVRLKTVNISSAELITEKNSRA